MCGCFPNATQHWTSEAIARRLNQVGMRDLHGEPILAISMLHQEDRCHSADAEFLDNVVLIQNGLTDAKHCMGLSGCGRIQVLFEYKSHLAG